MDLTICLFGKLSVHLGDAPLPGFESHKVRELLAYLCLYRDRPHQREALADLLWPKSTTSQSLKSLRHVLWQLQNAFNATPFGQDLGIVETDAEWISICLRAAVRLDVAEFERACTALQGRSGRTLDEQDALCLQNTLVLYRGDLLDGWYQDWCLFERERLQHLYLVLLEKQMSYCEAQGKYEAGLECGFHALRYDMAVEKVHRRIMRLYCLNGDRSAALRQYERCVKFLRQELDVSPSQRTVALYERIRSDYPPVPAERSPGGAEPPATDTPMSLIQALDQLKRAQTMFQHIGRQIQEAILALETVSLDRH